jgi:molecular chaperone Hsp33
MRGILNTYDIATVMLGRSMIGALLMAAHLKKGESVGVYFRGNGPMKLVFAEGDHSGGARAYTPEPQVQLPLKNKKLDLSAAIGIGLMEVVRGTAYSHKTHKGAVEIRTGQVGDDIAYYLYQSHQIPSVVALSVELQGDGRVKTAGGVLIELMPGASDNVIQKIETNMKQAKSLNELISQGATPEQLMQQYLKDFKMLKIDHHASIRYECRCSLDRVKKTLLLLGHDELNEMVETATNKTHEVSCDFCGKKYSIGMEELKKLRDKSYRNSLN